jgi:osmoprotectant transport system substrate-binding protein
VTKFLALAAFAFALTFAVAACSSDDDDNDNATPTATTASQSSGSSGASTGASGATGETGASGASGAASLDGASFSVGSKEFTEQLILGQIAVKALENAGADIDDNSGIVGTDNVRASLTSGEIDMYWEYTGTGWSSHLGREISDAPDTPEALATAVAEADKAENNVIWYDTAEMNNTYAIVTLKSRADDLDVHSISDYAGLVASDPDSATLCGATEWLTRDDGYPGLAQAYGFDLPDDKLTEFADTSPIAALVASGDQCNFGELFATDGTISANDLVVLDDDKQAFVPYNLALTVRGEVDEQYGDALHAIFDPITAKLTNETMQALNAKVDVDGEQPADVAEGFLKDNGFIQ